MTALRRWVIHLVSAHRAEPRRPAVSRSHRAAVHCTGRGRHTSPGRARDGEPPPVQRDGADTGRTVPRPAPTAGRRLTPPHRQSAAAICPSARCNTDTLDMGTEEKGDYTALSRRVLLGDVIPTGRPVCLN